MHAVESAGHRGYSYLSMLFNDTFISQYSMFVVSLLRPTQPAIFSGMGNEYWPSHRAELVGWEDLMSSLVYQSYSMA